MINNDHTHAIRLININSEGNSSKNRWIELEYANTNQMEPFNI